MKPEYEAWIKTFLENNNPRNLCHYATNLMVQEFQELKRERGYVLVENVYGVQVTDQHWWCVAEDGSIVDPTATQYFKVLEYEPYSEEKHGPLPVGKCPDCGGLIYPDNEHKGFCNEECRASWNKYMAKECAGWIPL